MVLSDLSVLNPPLPIHHPPQPPPCSEGDRLSGLVVDVLGETLVVASSAAWVELHRESISAALRSATGRQSLVWRPSSDMLAEEGLARGVGGGSEPQQAQQGDEGARGGAQGEGAEAGMGGEVVVLEHGLKLFASPQGQKTGF
jgi:23S rRNA G2069 N7-methylase RlmK/C1962 C5-methylase RlmI